MFFPVFYGIWVKEKAERIYSSHPNGKSEVEKYIHGLFPRWGIRFIGLVKNVYPLNWKSPADYIRAFLETGEIF